MKRYPLFPKENNFTLTTRGFGLHVPYGTTVSERPDCAYNMSEIVRTMMSDGGLRRKLIRLLYSKYGPVEPDDKPVSFTTMKGLMLDLSRDVTANSIDCLEPGIKKPINTGLILRIWQPSNLYDGLGNTPEDGKKKAVLQDEWAGLCLSFLAQEFGNDLRLVFLRNAGVQKHHPNIVAFMTSNVANRLSPADKAVADAYEAGKICEDLEDKQRKALESSIWRQAMLDFNVRFIKAVSQALVQAKQEKTTGNPDVKKGAKKTPFIKKKSPPPSSHLHMMTVAAMRSGPLMRS